MKERLQEVIIKFMKTIELIKNNFLKKIRIADILIASIVIISSILLINFNIKNVSLADKVQIIADSTIYEYPLSSDNVYEVQGAIGKTVVQVKNGKVRIIESECPNKTCIKQGEGENIICLPNKVQVRVIREDGFDAIVQ